MPTSVAIYSEGPPIFNLADLNEVLKKGGLYTLDEAEVILEMRKILAAKMMFSAALDVIEPRAAFCSYYAHSHGFGLALACQDKNIPLVDLLHGRHGPCQVPYTHFTQIPKNGYSMLPSHLWCWGDLNRRELIAHRLDAASSPEPVVGGNPWSALWTHGPGLPVAEADIAELAQMIDGRIPVLVTLTGTEKFILAKEILAVLKASTQDFFWLVRNHPGQVNHNHSFTTTFETQGIKNFNIELPTRLPLYFLFKHVQAHLTTFSSSAWEALSFGIPTLFVNEEGAKKYHAFIKQGTMAYAGNPQDALDWLKSAGPVNPEGAKEFLQSDPRIIKSKLSAISFNRSCIFLSFWRVSRRTSPPFKQT